MAYKISIEIDAKVAEAKDMAEEHLAMILADAGVDVDQIWVEVVEEFSLEM